MATEMLSESELDDRLSRSNPANRAALEDEGVRAALVSVQRSVESRASLEPPSRSVRRSTTYRRRWVLSGVVAVLVAVVTLVGVQALTGGNRSSGLPFAVPSAAAAQLNKVARAASGQSTPALGQWEYLAVKTEGTHTTSAAGARIAFTDTQTMQSWTATDGVERRRVSGHRFSFLSPQDKAAYLAHKAAFDAYLHYDPTVTGGNEDQRFPSPHTRAPAWETSPPSDPHALLNELWREYLSVNPDRATDPEIAGLKVTLNALRSGVSWSELSQVLLSSTSAKLRSRAYAALAYVSGTKVLGHQTDQLGRSGIAISRTGVLGNQTLIVSPSTGDLLEEDAILISRRAVHGIPTATLTAHEIYLQRSIVNSDTALPGGGNQPFVPSSHR